MSTMVYWADWSRVWGLTFGLEASTMQENVHWSLKSQLGTNCLPLHRFIGFLDKVMTRRQIKINHVRENPKSMDTLRTTLSNGFSAFVKCCEKCVITEGQYYLFAQFDEAQAYEIEQLTTKAAVMDKLRFEEASASAKRFSLMLDSIEKLEESGRYFLVKHREHDKQHVVAVMLNGSIACSCGEAAARGAPDRHVLCLLRNRAMVFRPSVHLHPLYLKRSSPDLEMSFSFKDEKVAFKPGARWDYVVSETKDPWKVKGMGMIQGAVIVGPSPSRKKKDKDTESLMRQKKAGMRFSITRKQIQGF